MITPVKASGKPAISDVVAKYRPQMSYFEDKYREFHANPELSLQESSIAAATASHLESLDGIEVRTKIGGHGVVGILRNGEGKTILLRAELDALPLREQTGLEYASSKRMVDIPDQIEKPVMHACGHDLHVVSLLAASTLLHACRELWSGTLLILFQPNEERGAGAQAMVDDGLYDSKNHAVPKPDVILAGHVMPARAGFITTRAGIFNSAADSFLVTLYGRGGHGAKPHMTIDPVVLASSTVMKLQTIVSRETNPQDAVVVTVGAIQAGSTENIISSEAVLRINTRTLTVQSRARVRAAIERIILGECQAANCPRPPLIQETSSFPLLYNDEKATAIVSKAMGDHFGHNFDPHAPVSMGSEDFGNLATPVSAAGCFWNYGGIDQQQWDDAKRRDALDEIAGNHSPFFAPVIQPTLTVAIDAYATAALAFLL